MKPGREGGRRTTETRPHHTVSGDPENTTILFLHGFLGSSADWKLVVEALHDNFCCVAADLPGHGASLVLPPEGYTTGGAAEAMVGLLDGLGVERPVIVGYSMGGRLALYLALRHPERCAGLFLESTTPGIEDGAERSVRRKTDEERARRLEIGDFDAFLQDWYQQPLFAPLARDEELLRRTIEQRRNNDPAGLARSLRGMGTGNQPSLWRELSGLRVPTLAVAGALDGKFVRIGRRMAEESLAARFTLVPNVGHNVHAEAPEAYLGLLRDFLHRVRTGAL